MVVRDVCVLMGGHGFVLVWNRDVFGCRDVDVSGSGNINVCGHGDSDVWGQGYGWASGQ